ncbi:MAG: hypothetical protein Q8P49_03060 [Candidatus Liptonbacteria bacterium]|nr:hypothetical protein [Candidatus Liptonbacteria bacterium]
MDKMIRPAFSKVLQWTFHARAKMRFYRLSEQRVKNVLHSPKRVEDGVAPKTVAMMQPVLVKTIAVLTKTVPAKAGTPSHSAQSRNNVGRQETWTQEIWVMIENKRHETRGKRQEVTKIISAWRYPGMTKPRSEITQKLMKQAYNEYLKT